MYSVRCMCLSVLLFSWVPMQWRIQDFPQGGAYCQSGCAYLFFRPKTAWKWKNLDYQEGARVPGAPPLRSTTAMWPHIGLFKLICFKIPTYWHADGWPSTERPSCCIFAFTLLAVADPGFSQGGGVNPPGGAWTRQIFPKTAWNRKNLDAQGGACVPHAPP